MSSVKYWAKRLAEAQAQLTTKSIKETEKQLQKYYSSTMSKVIEDFEKVYNKLINNMTEGKQLTPADLYKLNTYWQMQGQLKKELQRLGDKQAVLFSKKFMEQYINIYNALAITDDVFFSEANREIALQMIRGIWCADGKSWSERIWGNTSQLQQELNDGLIECVVAGKKPTELKKTLQERFSVSYHRADTVVKTEMAHIQTQAAQQRYKDYGIEMVEVWVDEDERTCPICASHEGEKHPVNAQMPIPFHPRCRCCVIPVVDDDFLEDEN